MFFFPCSHCKLPVLARYGGQFPPTTKCAPEFDPLSCTFMWWVIVGYVTPARPRTSRSLLVGKSKCAFSATLGAYSTLIIYTNIRFILSIDILLKPAR